MTPVSPAPIDLEISQLMKDLYDLKTGGSGNGPYSMVLREREDYGVNVGILEKEDSLILNFRGSLTFEDWVRDAISFESEEIPGVGIFPLGFSKGIEECRENLDHWPLSKKKVIIGGHSLGAAHAAIMAQILARDGILSTRLILMGCPRLVKNFTDLVHAGPSINYRNGKDYVTCDPPNFNQIYGFTDLSGGHDSFPGYFMYHHIPYYIEGITKILPK